MKAFTLIELLAVIAIVAVLAALLFPVLGSAKESAHKTSAMSNMRQSIIALNMYYDENGHFPELSVAREIVPRGVTTDPNDYWRPKASDNWPLMLGSFGYPFENMPIDEDVLMGMSGPQSVPLVTSIFYEIPHICPFQGDTPPNNAASVGCNVKMPDRVLVGRGDGSVKMESVPHLVEQSGTTQWFTWSSLFFALAKGH